MCQWLLRRLVAPLYNIIFNDPFLVKSRKFIIIQYILILELTTSCHWRCAVTFPFTAISRTGFVWKFVYLFRLTYLILTNRFNVGIVNNNNYYTCITKTALLVKTHLKGAVKLAIVLTFALVISQIFLYTRNIYTA